MDRLASIGEYKPLFAAAFPNEGMKAKTLAEAIATYERTDRVRTRAVRRLGRGQ